MPTQRRELKASYIAKDSTGRKRRIDHFQILIDTMNRDDFPHHTWAPVPGMDTFRTEDGQPVERVERDVYRVIVTGLELRSSAPDAP